MSALLHLLLSMVAVVVSTAVVVSNVDVEVVVTHVGVASLATSPQTLVSHRPPLRLQPLLVALHHLLMVSLVWPRHLTVLHLNQQDFPLLDTSNV